MNCCHSCKFYSMDVKARSPYCTKKRQIIFNEIIKCSKYVPIRAARGREQMN